LAATPRRVLDREHTLNRRATATPLGGVAVLSASGATLTIAMYGDLDLGAARTLRCVVDGAAVSGAGLVQFDLADVTFCDSQGLRLLERAVVDIAACGAAVAIARPSSAVTGVVRVGVAA
jgi:anti-anti-sigma factor